MKEQYSSKMAYLPRTSSCKNNCGAIIYFDRDSKVSHPSQDRWVPLEYNEDTGVYTGEKHNCPKYSNGQGQGQGQHSQTQQQQTQQHQELSSQKPIWDIVNAKLDRIIALLEKQR